MATFTYNNNIPSSPNDPSQDQPKMLTNTQSINSILGEDHFSFESGSGKDGRHQYSRYPERDGVGLPIPATDNNEGVIYTKEGANPTETNVFFRGESNGNEYQLTAVDQTNITTFAKNLEYQAAVVGVSPSYVGGWSFLPGGLILQYGSFSAVNGVTSYTVPFPKSFQAATVPYSINISRQDSAMRDFRISSGTVPNNTNFTLITTFTTGKFYWSAIGLS
jgi:hypothetical protein